MLIEKGNTFVDTIDTKEKYLKKRRYKTKAKLNIYLSIRVPEFDFGRLHEIYKNFPWEQHNHIKTALSKLKNLESDTFFVGIITEHMPAGILLPVSFSYTYMLFQSLNGIHKYVHIHTKQKEPAYAYRHEIKAFIHAKDMNNQ